MDTVFQSIIIHCNELPNKISNPVRILFIHFVQREHVNLEPEGTVVEIYFIKMEVRWPLEKVKYIPFNRPKPISKIRSRSSGCVKVHEIIFMSIAVICR